MDGAIRDTRLVRCICDFVITHKTDWKGLFIYDYLRFWAPRQGVAALDFDKGTYRMLPLLLAFMDVRH